MSAGGGPPLVRGGGRVAATSFTRFTMLNIMLTRLAADAVLLLHLAFILFAVFGALLALHWRWLPLIHLPAAGWAMYVELAGELCPLTTLENYLLQRAGDFGYSDSFIDHYLIPLLYPPGLKPATQNILAGLVLVINLALYGWLLLRLRRAHAGRPSA
jgi:hypothetical protein